MAILVQRGKGNKSYEEVGPEYPLAVEINQKDGAPDVPVVSRVHKTERRPVAGIGTGLAYAAADAFGTRFAIPVPPFGTIASLVFLDYDDEGIPKEFVLFEREFTATTDNDAFAVSDADLSSCVGVITVDVFNNFGNNQIAVASPALAYSAPGGYLYCQVVTRGADNIAAGSIPEFFMVIV